ncbi:MAG: M48 family metalloprotease [Saprospiraceae bacterium]|nr:M48 family metalloprotease [Saprospiraceae bacterium]
MNSSFMISDTVVRALGWALVHSLWQGAFFALLLLVLLPRLRSSQQRYLVAYGALMAVFTAAAFTFCWMFEPSETVQITANDVPTFGPFLIAHHQLTTYSFWERMTDWLEVHHVLIVLLWLLGFVFFLFRLGAGLWQVHRLQTQHIQPVGAIWQAKIEVLGARLGIKKAIGLFESALVRSPMAIGWLKPVILLPIGLINRLSPAEVEAILAHELAHIARRDWIFNLLQAFVEALFYYHPAVWWVSAVVRRERENCCDDAALAATGNPLVFAKALVQVQELAAPAPMLALGIGGASRRRPLLLERIRRILNQPQQKSQVMEKLTATAILLALLTFIGLRANTPPTVAAAIAQISDWPGTLWNTANNGDQIVTDSVPKPKSIHKITREDDNGKVELEMKDGEITRLNVDGKEIPASEFDQYNKLAAELQRSTPPVPPVPPFPAMPPFPEMPAMPPFPAIAPMPPMPPMPNLSSSLETLTDEAGNVIIKLQKDGKPIEIKVKDGEVWMDGKKLEKGESIQLPGMGFNFGEMDWNLNYEHDINAPEDIRIELPEFDFAFKMSDIASSFSDEDRARWEEHAAKLREEALRHREEYQSLMEQHRELSAEDREMMEKEWKAHQKDWEKNAKEWEKNQEKWQKGQEKWQEKQGKWQAENPNWNNKRNSGNNFQQIVKSELLRENLIESPTDYSFKLSPKSLKINGKKQSGETHQKYLNLYERVTGKKMGSSDNYTLEEHD